MKILSSEVTKRENSEFKDVLNKLGELNATKWHSGDIDPTSDLGREGDFYINIVTKEFFKNTNGQWETKGDLRGQDGLDGLDGADGQIGKSAYEVWVDNGNTGTVTDFLNAITGLVGPRGPKGDKGLPGEKGERGPKGQKGDDGREIELRKTATAIEWRYENDSQWQVLLSLKDIKGTTNIIGGGGPPQVSQIVNHGSTANTQRPPIGSPVIWIGTVEPLNAKDFDVWIEPT